MPHVLELYEMLEKSFHCQFPGGLNVKVPFFCMEIYLQTGVSHISFSINYATNTCSMIMKLIGQASVG